MAAMSQRRSKGDIVWKQPGAGFVMRAGWIVLRGDPGPCLLDCGDPDCLEWDGQSANGGWAYHVSECQMGH